MAICLDYQRVYYRKRRLAVSNRTRILAVALLLFALVSKVWIKIETTSIGYDLAEARKVALALDMERRELELKRSLLLRPDNLSVRAERELNLHALQLSQVKRISIN